MRWRYYRAHHAPAQNTRQGGHYDARTHSDDCPPGAGRGPRLNCGGDESANSDKSAGTSARSVILLIGDGMGMAHRTAGRLYAVGRGGRLAMDTLPVEGAARTWSTESVVTDSAAAGTALATGVKTLNKAVAVDPEGKSVPTVLEMAKSAGKSTGLVTTVFLTDATPAAFAAHNADRRDYLDIATDMFNHNVDVLLGGGEKLLPARGATGCFPNDSARTDGRNLIEEAVAEGYKHVCTENDLTAVSPDSTDKLFGTIAADSMTRPYDAQPRRDGEEGNRRPRQKSVRFLPDGRRANRRGRPPE